MNDIFLLINTFLFIIIGIIMFHGLDIIDTYDRPKSSRIQYKPVGFIKDLVVKEKYCNHIFISNKERFEIKFKDNEYGFGGCVCTLCNSLPQFCKKCDTPKCKCKDGLGWPITRFMGED